MPHVRRVFVLPMVFMVISAFLGAALGADNYELDESHTKVGFKVRHMVVSNVRGEFTDYTATIRLDENDITKSSLEGKIRTASIDTNNERRDNHLRSDDFFDAQQYPEITFKSTKIEKQSDGYVMTGELAIRGVTKEIQLPFSVTGPIVHGGQRRIGFEAELVINRQDYGVKYDNLTDAGGLIVGNDVTIELNGEAIKQ